MDRERRVDKRKYRLIAATEEAFSRLHSINEEYFQKNVSALVACQRAYAHAPLIFRALLFALL